MHLLFCLRHQQKKVIAVGWNWRESIVGAGDERVGGRVKKMDKKCVLGLQEGQLYENKIRRTRTREI